jgi:hypothetical protein
MITNVSSLQRLPLASPRGGSGGATTATQGTSRTGADQETSASTDGNAATQDYKGAKDTKGAKDATGTKDSYGTDSNGEKRDASGLSEGERKQLEELKDRDTEVHNHENAHQSAGGQFAGAPSYSYQTGPDGKRYAIGGEVSIDVSTEKDPAATIAKMERISRAATAPAEPSPQDYKVAAAAQRMMVEAQRDLDAAKLDQIQGGGETAGQGQETGSDKNQGEKAQEQASSTAAVAAAMQAYQSAAALVRSATARGGIDA